MKQEKTTPDSKEGLHTQGEWKVSKQQFSLSAIKLRNPIMIEAHGVVAYVSIHDYGETMAKANAELICKAVNERQALLGALRDAFATLLRWQEQESDLWDERDDETLENIQTAINTANKTLRQ